VTLSVAVAAPCRAHSALSRSWTRAGGLVLAVAVLAIAAACSLAYGSKAIPLNTVVDAFFAFDPTNNDHVIIRDLRVPRTVIGILVGAALGLAGAVMQGVTRNPLADPALLGVEAGASLAVVAGIAAFDIAN
jgi:iron complex transport system permease protein